jgi:hypothetical protein
VDETSYANMDDIETMSKRVLAPYFHAEDQKPTTVCIWKEMRKDLEMAIITDSLTRSFGLH